MAMQLRLGLAAVCAAFVVFSAVWPVSPARAQDADIRVLSDALDRLRNDLIDLQRDVYRGEVPPPSAESGIPPPPDPEAVARAARAEMRFGELEDRMRSLTGQIEEIAHEIGQVAGRVDKLVGDVDFRLTAIERAQAEALARVEEARATTLASGQAQPGAVQPAASGQAPAAPPPAGEPGSLGTVSSNALSLEGGADALASATAAPTTPALPPGTAKQQYEYAFSLLRRQEYGEAARALTAFIASHPDDQLAGNAHYWLAETYYVRGDYRKAAGYFAAGYKNFPESSKAPDNLLKLAMSLANLDQPDNACFTFKELSERFPNASQSIMQRAAFESRRAGCG